MYVMFFRAFFSSKVLTIKKITVCKTYEGGDK